MRRRRTVDRVTVIVPLGRPGDLSNVIENFRRQTFKRKRLVVVENGPAVGACAAHRFAPNRVLRSGHSPGAAKNVGIRWVLQHGGGYVAPIDGDDLYCAEYLAELIANSNRADVVGKSAQWVRTAGGTLRFFGGVGEGSPVTALNGPTTAFWAEDAVEFDEGMRWGEDGDWLERMRATGATFWATSRNHYMYRRFPASAHHTWTMTDYQMVQGTPGAVYDAGPEELDVVTGKKRPPLWERVPQRPLRDWDHPGWTAAHDEQPPFPQDASEEDQAMFLINTSPMFTIGAEAARAALRIERAYREVTLCLAPDDRQRLSAARRIALEGAAACSA